ncbi:MAG: hypothetical protein HC890_08405 [Chloroflexaceae bacterium]|nr:hypothetical protein [Chloroflexaceae bacterium]
MTRVGNCQNPCQNLGGSLFPRDFPAATLGGDRDPFRSSLFAINFERSRQGLLQTLTMSL